jgi:hypothetical protein
MSRISLHRLRSFKRLLGEVLAPFAGRSSDYSYKPEVRYWHNHRVYETGVWGCSARTNFFGGLLALLGAGPKPPPASRLHEVSEPSPRRHIYGATGDARTLFRDRRGLPDARCRSQRCPRHWALPRPFPLRHIQHDKHREHKPLLPLRWGPSTEPSL